MKPNVVNLYGQVEIKIKLMLIKEVIKKLI